jgi:DNA repair exonuclease SbcCD ATPase subunit
MSWKAKLQSYGLTEETAPNLVKKAIAEKKQVEKEAKNLKEQLESGNLSDEQRAEIEETLQDVPDALKQADANILKKVEYWERMKDSWAASGEKLKAMGRGRPKKNQAEKGQQVEEQKPKPPEPPQPPVQQVVELEAEEIKPTKSGGFGKIGVFLLLGLLSFGAYNYLKNND